MKRRSRAGGKPAKVRRRSALKPKGRSAPKAMPRRGSAPAGQDTEVARLTRERDEALGQQAATADVLRIISSSPGNLDSVLETILANATRLCEANFGVLLLYESAQFRVAAAHNPPPAFAELRRRQPEIRSSGVLARVAVTKQLLHIADCTEDASYKQGDDDFVAFVDLCGVRTLLDAPLLKKGELIGTIALYRQEVRLFTNQQVELVRNFAAQAVIAIENARLLNELRKSLQQQTATSDVLKIISRSTFDLQTVLNTLVESAARLCAADRGLINHLDEDLIKFGASYGFSREAEQYALEHPARVGRDNASGRVVLEGRTIHIPDVFADPEYHETDRQKALGYRTLLGVPLLRQGTPIGVFALTRDEVNPFTDKQIELVTTFGDQAVIAIENARLLSELRQRTADLTESLEQQTATSEVLRVISSSPGDVQPVFEAMLEKAVRICGATFGNLFLCEDGAFRVVAMHNAPPAYAEARMLEPIHPGPATALGRLARTKQAAQIDDLMAEPGYVARDPLMVTGVEVGGIRTLVAVPMLKATELVGSIVIYRHEVRPFSKKQVEIVSNFAAQAVIAIENARLLNELRQRTTDLTERTADLTEALEQQTATSEVLQVISSSPGVLEPVFSTVLEKAVRICEAKFGTLYLYERGKLRLAAARDVPPAFAKAQGAGPFDPAPSGMLDLVIKTGRTVHLPDLAATQAYLERHPIMVQAVDLGGIRTVVGVPMLKDSLLVGLIGVFRQEVRPFTEKQVALLTNFAAQAVIAIENARLLNELRQRTSDLSESLEQQTATSEVLQTISSSPGDLQPVFEAMLEKAIRVCNAKFGYIYRWGGDALDLVAAYNVPPAFAEARRGVRIRLNPSWPVGRMLATKTTVHVADCAADPLYTEERDPLWVEGVDVGGIRTLLAVPMLKEDELVGVFIVYRQEVRPFSDKQIALVTNFAAQAVIAIENARLLSELRQRTADLTESLEQQTATSEVLQTISGSPGDLRPVFAAMLEKAVSICDADFGNIYRWDGEAFSLLATHSTPLAFAEARRRSPLRAGPGTPLARMIASKTVIHLADALGDPSYAEQRDPAASAAVELGGVRTVLLVPMLRESELIGSFTVYRQQPRPFTDKQIALVQNFASQAVIAIENTRLLNELRQRTEEVEKLNQHLEQRVTDQVDEIERMGRLRRFLPPQVADLIVASGTEKQLESHRREVTALFCDLRGFTGFSESSDPEDVMTLLRDYHAAIGEIIVKYNGTLERYAGDGVMVVFNDPIPVDNPAIQAVQMALEMREAIGALTEKWRQLGHEIGFGIGIAHGYATLGTIGFEGRFDYAAIGTVSNVASRLCDEAKPGQILISPRVLMAVKDAVTVEPVGEFELKGIRRPIAAYNVVAALPPSP